MARICLWQMRRREQLQRQQRRAELPNNLLGRQPGLLTYFLAKILKALYSNLCLPKQPPRITSIKSTESKTTNSDNNQIKKNNRIKTQSSPTFTRKLLFVQKRTRTQLKLHRILLKKLSAIACQVSEQQLYFFSIFTKLTQSK